MKKEIALLLTGIGFIISGFVNAQKSSDPLYFSSKKEDKLSLYKNRLGDNNMYGLGVESNTLYFKTYKYYRWYGRKNADGGKSELMELNKDGELKLEGDYGSIKFSPNRLKTKTNWNKYGASAEIDGGKIISSLSAPGGGKTQIYGGEIIASKRVKTKEIICTEDVWPDYVFENDYNLRSLKEVEKFIDENGHLPEIPSANDVKDGYSLGKLDVKLLEKIEELTLYLIDLEKKYSDLKKQVETNN